VLVAWGYMGTFARTVSVDDFVRPRPSAGGALLSSAMVTGIGTLILTCTIGVLATAFLMVGSLNARKLSLLEASPINTALILNRGEPVSSASDGEGPSPIFNPALQPDFDMAGVTTQSSVMGSFWRRLSPISSLIIAREAALYSHKHLGQSSETQLQDAPPLPRPRPSTSAPSEAMYRPVAPMVANARPTLSDSGAVNLELPTSLDGLDPHTALYDIEARTVYMPNGETLEAHSGLGDRLDDTRYVSEKDRGPTPPHIYDLRLREQLFHGVQAVRLNPVGDRNPFGRAGLLAHSYMLGVNGDSNGCVSIKDYEKFLKAVSNGAVTRLVVVKHLTDPPPIMASTLGKFIRYAFQGD
jgi:hypothetical protein